MTLAAQAAGLDPEPLRRLRSALVYVKKTKRMLPLGANFTVLSASTRWGPTEASEESKAASQASTPSHATPEWSLCWGGLPQELRRATCGCKTVPRQTWLSGYNAHV